MPSAPTRPLLVSRRFAPLFLTQFLGAMNGNLVKTAMLFLVVFKAGGSGAMTGSIAAAVFVAPMVLFSAFAGALADMYDKAVLTRWIKLAETAFIVLAACAVLLPSTALMLVALFLLGTTSAFFGPIKYAILPQHVAHEEVMAATGLVEAGTFVAILLGQIVGSLILPLASAMLAFTVALIGIFAARAIPPAPPALGTRAKLPQPVAATIDVVTGSRRTPAVYVPILAISWFWGVGAVLTSQLPVVVHETLGAAPSVATLMLAMFSLGVAAGSMLAGKLAAGARSLRPVAWSAVVMSVALGAFVWLVGSYRGDAAAHNVVAFVADPGAVAMLAVLGLVALAGGVFVVPLYTMLQLNGEASRRSRDVAANNILNALFMVAATAAAALFALADLSSPVILGITALANLVVAAMLLHADHHVFGVAMTTEVAGTGQ